MKKKKGLFSNQIVNLLVIVVVAGAVLFAYNTSTKPKQISSADLTTPVDMASIDSSNCIACHTDEGKIASLAIVDDSNDHGAEGG